MKKLLLATALAIASTTAANAWTDRAGHWHEGPTLYGPINPGAVYAPYGVPPAYGYGAPPPVAYGYGAPVVVAPPPTDTQVIAGTILGIAGMAIDASRHGRHW
jgi:hypothetical protein